jgi:hypothetical protein
MVIVQSDEDGVLAEHSGPNRSMNQPARRPVGPLWARASEKMNATAALLAPKPSRTGATKTGKPLLMAVLIRELRKPPNQTIHHP